MKIIHYNLKSNNVIKDPIDILKILNKAYVYMKFLDFSISKVEVKNTLQICI